MYHILLTYTAAESTWLESWSKNLPSTRVFPSPALMVLKVAVPGGGERHLLFRSSSILSYRTIFFPLQHGEHAASESCRKAGRSRSFVHHGTKQTFAINRGKKLLLPISVLKSRGLGEERGEVTVQLLLVVHIH